MPNYWLLVCWVVIGMTLYDYFQVTLRSFCHMLHAIHHWSDLTAAVVRSEQMQVSWVWLRSTWDWRWPLAFQFLSLWPRLTCAHRTSCKRRCRCCTRFSSRRDAARCPYSFRQSTTWLFLQWTSPQNGKTQFMKNLKCPTMVTLDQIRHGVFY